MNSKRSFEDSTFFGNADWSGKKKCSESKQEMQGQREIQDGGNAERHPSLTQDVGCSPQREWQHSRQMSENTVPRCHQSSPSVVDHDKAKLSKKRVGERKEEAVSPKTTFPKLVPSSTNRENVQGASKEMMACHDKVAAVSLESLEAPFPQQMPCSTHHEMTDGIRTARRTWKDEHKSAAPLPERDCKHSTCEAQPSLKPPSRISHKRIEMQLAAEQTKAASFPRGIIQDGTGVAAMPSIAAPEYPLWTRHEDNTQNDCYVKSSVDVLSSNDSMFNPNVASMRHLRCSNTKARGLNKGQERRRWSLSALEQGKIHLDELQRFPNEEWVPRNNEGSIATTEHLVEPGAVSMSSNGPRALHKGRLTAMQGDVAGSQDDSQSYEEAIVARASSEQAVPSGSNRWCCKNRFEVLLSVVVLLMTIAVAVIVPLLMIRAKDDASVSPPMPTTPFPMPAPTFVPTQLPSTSAPTPAPTQ